MKKSILFSLAVLCIAVLLPLTALATNFTLSGTDLQITVDETYWYVFTRDNIRNNPELDELGLTYEQMNEIFQENYAYMDALLLYDDGDFVEMFVRKKAVEGGMANLSNYSDADVLSVGKILGEKTGSSNYRVYQSQYKFVRLESTDAGFYLCEFYTVVNGEGYTITFQSLTAFSDAEYAEMETIINSICFNVDPTLKEPVENSDASYTIVTRTIAGAAAGGAVGLVVGLVKKKKKAAEQTQPIQEQQ